MLVSSTRSPLPAIATRPVWMSAFHLPHFCADGTFAFLFVPRSNAVGLKVGQLHSGNFPCKRFRHFKFSEWRLDRDYFHYRLRLRNNSVERSSQRRDLDFFRHFYGLRRLHGNGPPLCAVVGVLNNVPADVRGRPTHLGVATDHVIESLLAHCGFGYTPCEGIEPALLGPFRSAGSGPCGNGDGLWPMIDLEADDALASPAAMASRMLE